MATGAGSVWVDGYGSHSVIRVDPVALKVVKQMNLPDQIWDVAFAAGAIWEHTNRISALKSAHQPEDEQG